MANKATFEGQVYLAYATAIAAFAILIVLTIASPLSLTNPPSITGTAGFAVAKQGK